MERAGDVAVAEPLKVLIADDHPLMIAGVRRVVERSDDIEIVGEAHSGPEVIAMVERRRPQVLLIDLRMPGVSGTELIEKIRESWPEVKIVVLSACEDRESIDAALDAGASTYILKSVHTHDIASALRQAATGGVFHAASSRRGAGMAEAEPREPMLTERQRTILAAVAAGMTTAAISKELWVTEHTVKFHLTNIYRVIGVPNRATAVRWAIDNGMVATPGGREPERVEYSAVA